MQTSVETIQTLKSVETRMGKLSSIGFGALRIIDPTAVSVALAEGINFFATSDMYGVEHLTALANALRQTNQQYFLAVKVGIHYAATHGENQFKQSREEIRSAVNRCTFILRRRPLDLVLLHRLDTVNYSLNRMGQYVPAWENALDELIILQNEGQLRHIGLSEPTAQQLTRAMNLAKEYGSSIAAIESAYSIATRRAEENGVKDICDRERITFFAYSSIMRGFTNPKLQQLNEADFALTDEQFRDKVFRLLGIKGNIFRQQIDMFLPPYIKHNIRQILRFQQYASAYQITPAQLALAWVQHQGVIPIPGSVNFEHMRENSQAARLMTKLEQTNIFNELDKDFPFGIFQGDPNPLSLSGILDVNSAELNMLANAQKGSENCAQSAKL